MVQNSKKVHTATAETVKVPQMAESISEGTLKSWSKQVGDSVAADEEVATIETDKVRVVISQDLSGAIVFIWYRSTCLSVHRRLVLSRSCWPTKRTLSL